jgi:predicted ArsR family transcriptional regulator
LAVLEALKRFPEGLSVPDLSGELGMSYMGIKAHCIALQGEGLVVTWRQPSSKGRPRILYRLTTAGEALFAGPGNDLASALLREAAVLFGSAAPRKLLLLHFRSMAVRYGSRLPSGDPGDRVRAFVRLRDEEGRICSLREGERPEIHECHNPLADLMEEYPGVDAMEETMVGEVLGVAVRRRQEGSRVVFAL